MEYLVKSSGVCYGLPSSEVKLLAYEYSIKLDLKILSSWIEAKQTGSDWLSGFMKQHPSLSLRTPESTSRSCATSFNKHNNRTFFDKYSSVLERDGFTPHKNWNVDETGCTTVQKRRKIVLLAG